MRRTVRAFKRLSVRSASAPPAPGRPWRLAPPVVPGASSHSARVRPLIVRLSIVAAHQAQLRSTPVDVEAPGGGRLRDSGFAIAAADVGARAASRPPPRARRDPSSARVPSPRINLKVFKFAPLYPRGASFHFGRAAERRRRAFRGKPPTGLLFGKKIGVRQAAVLSTSGYL